MISLDYTLVCLCTLFIVLTQSSGSGNLSDMDQEYKIPLEWEFSFPSERKIPSDSELYSQASEKDTQAESQFNFEFPSEGKYTKKDEVPSKSEFPSKGIFPTNGEYKVVRTNQITTHSDKSKALTKTEPVFSFQHTHSDLKSSPVAKTEPVFSHSDVKSKPPTKTEPVFSHSDLKSKPPTKTEPVFSFQHTHSDVVSNPVAKTEPLFSFEHMHSDVRSNPVAKTEPVSSFEHTYSDVKSNPLGKREPVSSFEHMHSDVKSSPVAKTEPAFSFQHIFPDVPPTSHKHPGQFVTPTFTDMNVEDLEKESKKLLTYGISKMATGEGCRVMKIYLRYSRLKFYGEDTEPLLPESCSNLQIYGYRCLNITNRNQMSECKHLRIVIFVSLLGNFFCPEGDSEIGAYYPYWCEQILVNCLGVNKPTFILQMISPRALIEDARDLNTCVKNVFQTQHSFK